MRVSFLTKCATNLSFSRTWIHIVQILLVAASPVLLLILFIIHQELSLELVDMVAIFFSPQVKLNVIISNKNLCPSSLISCGTTKDLASPEIRKFQEIDKSTLSCYLAPSFPPKCKCYPYHYKIAKNQTLIELFPECTTLN